MGPEHSSARPERFLQMCSDDPEIVPTLSDDVAVRQLHDINWIVANCTTPSNYFHILRRQIALPFRKPLIMMTPKSLLRHPEARSSFDDMAPGTSFQRIITDPLGQSNCKKIVFCCGKVYYDLKKARSERSLDSNVAIVRVEQVAPFPYDVILEESNKHPDAEFVWAQEEHKNQGCWTYVEPRFRALFPNKHIRYAGRVVAASPATGSKHQHYKEQAQLYEDTFG